MGAIHRSSKETNKFYLKYDNKIYSDVYHNCQQMYKSLYGSYVKLKYRNRRCCFAD